MSAYFFELLLQLLEAIGAVEPDSRKKSKKTAVYQDDVTGPPLDENLDADAAAVNEEPDDSEEEDETASEIKASIQKVSQKFV